MPGNEYTIEYLADVVENDIPKLPKRIKASIKRAIESPLATDPIGFGKPLQYSLKGYRRIRVGDYRIVYRIIPEQTLVIIAAVKHRKEVYKH